MKFITRKYQPGDEVQINRMYNVITGKNRTLSEYEWEWLKTWHGRGFMWLLFDIDKPEDDQFVAQYSLLPVPFSIWGESHLAGKTENCMCHPDYRGSIYFPHEKQSFAEARRTFGIFFTTTGNVSSGKVGAIRRKLGYISFDSWVFYLRFLSRDCSKTGNFKMPFRKKIPLAHLIATFLSFYSELFPQNHFDGHLKLYSKEDVPLEEIEQFWKQNKQFYGITVDRTAAYLNWRINQNPYAEHRYLAYTENGLLSGYAIFAADKNHVIHIVDIISEKQNARIVGALVKGVVAIASREGAQAISFSTTRGNGRLGRIFLSNGFVSTSFFVHLREIFKGVNRKQFHVFIPENYKNIQKISDPRFWYMTDLVKEGCIE